MSTGSKVVLLLSFVFIGVLVWYYGPSSASTDQIAQDPVLQQPTPATTIATRPDPTPPVRPIASPSSGSQSAPRPLSPVGPMPDRTASLSNSPSYLVMGQAMPAPVSPSTARLRSPAPVVPAPVPTTPTTTISRTIEAVSAPPARTYVVTAGDTLSGISVTYYGTEVEWNRIAEANPRVDPDRLRVGTRLQIPAYTPRSSRTARSAAPATASRSVVPGGRSHRVEDGESLSSIADRYYGRETQWTRIFEANRDVLQGNPDRLRIGMVLAIPSQ